MTEAQQQQVRQVLSAALASTVFHSAHRGCRFLVYIVEQALDGAGPRLKERTIGIEVFDRPPEYSTGDDAVVRVQAGDVRKRLQRFYATPEADALPVEIMLPLGTYCPEFRFRRSATPNTLHGEPAAPEAPLETAALETAALRPPALVPAALEPPTLELPVSTSAPDSRAPTSTPFAAPALAVVELSARSAATGWRRTPVLIAAALLCGLALFFGLQSLHLVRARSLAETFWAPLLAERRPVLVCISKTATYHPSEALFIEYQKTHPAEFTHEWEREGQPLPLPPNTPLHWKDLQVWNDYGVASGDVYAAQELTVAFSRMQKENHLRIGQDYGYADLRQDPSILVGAFNNRWTMEMSRGMPFRFVETGHSVEIDETGGQKRMWVTSAAGEHRFSDYAIVARILNADTGNFVLILGGLGSSGTQAATELVTDPQYLDRALKTLPGNWPTRNIAFVLRTSVMDSIAGPPTIVASGTW